MVVMRAGNDARWEDNTLYVGRSTIARPLEGLNANRDGMGSSVSGGRRRRRWRGFAARYNGGIYFLLLFFLISIFSPADAAFINFDNCLEESIVQSNPQQLQFVPMFLSVHYDPSTGPNPLNITVYGNVTGLATDVPYPPPDSPQWTNPNDTVGKITDVSVSNNRYSTLFTTLDVLTFTPYNNASRFCLSVIQGECPLGPVFYANASNPADLRAFSIQHDLGSSYQFMSIVPTLRVRSGDASDADLACVSAIITPDLGSTLRGLVGFLPLLILVFVAVANILAAIYSPWGSTDPFRWTSNYGRDEDLLRLVTPGFADCLQYIQFIVLTGALSLNYPGYYQPVVAQGAWSALMFNQSFVSAYSGRNPVVDGVYTVNGTYGLDRYSQYVGLTAVRDIWPSMVIWLLAIIAAVTALTEVAFGFRWVYHRLANVPEEDLRAKNMPFTMGNVIRIVFNFMLLPVISLSMFQLVVAADSPAYSVALAVVLILALVTFSCWVVRLIATTRPRSYLYDDLSTVLLYGPLYNTYCDDAAAFALVPIFIAFIRGIAIGALQPSGIAQLVLLAICEVVLVLTLLAFRPYPSPTSMNLYQILFAMVRFLVVLLSVSFVPSLGISEQTRGWIGYVILFIHAMLLVFGFFLNALQTLIEVVARLAGAGGVEGAATRGGLAKVFGARQLSRRHPRSGHVSRQSMASDAAMLAHMDDRSTQFGGSRARSLSGSSAMLLNRPAPSEGRPSLAFEGGSAHGRTHSRANSSGVYTPTTPGAPSAFSHPAGYQPMAGTPKSGSMAGFKPTEPYDPYYRPPRPRGRTVPSGSMDSTRRNAGSAGDAEENVGDGPGEQPVPAYLGTARDDADFDDGRPMRKDYAVREVDFYYRVRGPALSHTGTRKLKTGPADPTGPVSSATGWFRRLLGGKTKEKSKGFEVVRSTRAPPPGLFPPGEGEFHEPYRDDPDAVGSDEPAGGHSRQISGVTASSYHDSEGEEQRREEEDAEDAEEAEERVGEVPQLPQIDSGDAIELPSRMGSRASTHVSTRPAVPRKSSQRQPPGQSSAAEGTLVAIPGSPTNEADGRSSSHLRPESQPGRLPFTTSDSSSKRAGSVDSTTSTVHRTVSEQGQPSGMGYVSQHRAGASIHEAAPPPTGSTAELVDQTTDSE
ncbi:hypothetical protein VTN77DRAFT_6839 [Rasamsonia byssochlamydoides]|uniref:uncharacterized protein n=1 Tax=Rasamsonia byssochlamydoides TaxID=89139 RepID=UPI0037425B6D